ncbi:MAG: hypothetical protein DMG01_22370 [Acidobacteria bacterium]|nr:MAG: hypothetical protein DMG01_22370 [Acidobacteriota bacterium]
MLKPRVSRLTMSYRVSACGRSGSRSPPRGPSNRSRAVGPGSIHSSAIWDAEGGPPVGFTAGTQAVAINAHAMKTRTTLKR